LGLQLVIRGLLWFKKEQGAQANENKLMTYGNMS